MNTLLTVKLRRDLRASWPRMLMMVIAIAVSLMVFGGVLAAYVAVGRETRAAYADTEPASATIVLDKAIDVQRMAVLVNEARQRDGVVEATGRTQFSGEVEVNGQVLNIPIQVFVATPDDPLRMAKFYPQHSSWPPPPGQILLGRDSLELLNVAIGDSITVQTSTGERMPLKVADTVYDPSLSPSPQEQTGRGYLSTTSLPASAMTMDQLKIQVAEVGQTAPSRNRDRIMAVARDVGSRLQAQGLSIREIQVPKPYAHPHQWQADSLLIALLTGGAAALLLSTILVANMLNNLFTQQVPQIGIMKAIGARSSRIGRHYLATTLVVAAAATVLAVPLAVLIGRAGVGMFLGFLGIQPASMAAPWWAYLIIAATGLALPPLMALWPLVKTSRTTV